ncbi:hypothetical protein BMAPRL20_A0003 [Burkholderia mallei PRL-20]|uniref:Uncharacterized protein n=1 Tax=Burkholderia pseudomallei 1710a TaxID=320371 RepID=A0A0E1W455_BURPE|nr:hypothetical protein BMASAVP1_A2816 [Burkholderia mallei SAVP1]ABO04845.1 hypothetical protein BMA10247_2343 [Burkholderia mallei NCTC 10247]ACQ95250.1 conserved hypothetical protein [Burkholderia pseudomallei MSHR346]AFR14028.1 hypothetical protein BPC006_I0137 [Burkholderia pseudomallei BPC006]EEH29310.1 conserved hypothetical protein [Burkholderia pseudomallei Pakistan 9]EEP87036.1 hypothetical protein BMAGB8_0139 [Burkholderia mallei GB8 horse 4]EES24246.1 hypothetical protein BURPS110
MGFSSLSSLFCIFFEARPSAAHCRSERARSVASCALPV